MKLLVIKFPKSPVTSSFLGPHTSIGNAFKRGRLSSVLLKPRCITFWRVRHWLSICRGTNLT
jgi:hypothetical protein